MAKLAALAIVALGLAALGGPPAQGQAPKPTATLSLGAALGELPRFGLNLGGRSVWGAEQLMANVLQNPGLEPGLDGALIVVKQTSAEGVEDDTPWAARPPGFWAGAHYQVLSGAAAGQAGQVLDNHRARPEAGDSLLLAPQPRGLQPGDVLALQGQQDRSPAPLWWRQGLVQSLPEPRPGSPGQRALRLQAVAGQPAALFHHLDSIGERAGKLLPVQGRWRLSLWLRGGPGTGSDRAAMQPGPAASPAFGLAASRAAPKLRLSFGRQGHAPWLERSLSPGPAWRQQEFEFDTQDDGPPGPLMLALSVEQGTVWLDDLWLGAAGPATPGGFRPEVVENLRRLRPGYLRDWQGQLGDSAANRLAPPWARQPSRYRPGADDWLDAYSLPEFLALCAGVGARPWVILPATSSPEQAHRFGQALADGWQRHHFEEIVVEHGNEHWNAVFRPAGVASAPALAALADRAFAALKQGAGAAVPLHRVLGAQFVNPQASAQLAGLARQIEGIALAPYFLYRQQADEPPEAALSRALHEDMAALAETRAAIQRSEAGPNSNPGIRPGRSLDVYEVNFHTTGGNASAAQRSAALLAPAAGTALARRLIQAASLGVRRQAVYSLAGFDSFADMAPGQPRQLLPLFGITRDLAGPGHWRPTGQALQALNAIAGGPGHSVNCSGPACAEISALAWASGARWAIASSAGGPIMLRWPCQADQQMALPLSPELPARSPPALGALACQAGWAQAELPAQALATLSAAGAGAARERRWPGPAGSAGPNSTPTVSAKGARAPVEPASPAPHGSRPTSSPAP